MSKKESSLFPSNPPIRETNIKYIFDNKEKKIYKQSPDGKLEDITQIIQPKQLK